MGAALPSTQIAPRRSRSQHGARAVRHLPGDRRSASLWANVILQLLPRTCVCLGVMTLLGACATTPAPIAAPGSTAADYGTVVAAKYVINNNVWGKAHSPAGRESVYCTNDTSPVSWGTAYNWPVGDKPYQVKAFPSIISGWHWGTWSPNSGLPVRVADRRSVRTSGSYVLTNPGVQNVAYDCWFHAIDHPDNQSQPTDELMIWVARFGGAGPLGKLQGEVEIGGATWAVYKGEVGWNVFSFVRASNVTAWQIDVRDFIDYLVATKGWMEKEKYLTSVQFGTEIFRSEGEGRLDVKDYRCDVEN
jgi:xyloglucan-specific endo-beta-1,4-glucanase